MGLTADQMLGATTLTGHIKVLAGAGSGKSTMLVARIVNLIKSGVPPSSILVVMYGKAASNSFEERLKRNLKSLNCELPTVTTFHSMGTNQLIKPLVAAGALPPMRLETKEWEFKKMAVKTLENFLPDNKAIYSVLFDFLSFIELTKSHLDGPHATMRQYNFSSEHSYFPEAFNRFERIRLSSKVRFFSDLMYDPVRLLVEKPNLIEIISNKFDHIMVDEYQDINNIQQFMLTSIAGSRSHVMVVGDDDQCIFVWRGANPYFMIEGFEKSFPEAKTIILREGFRYGHQIATAASYLISNNKNRNPKISVSAPTAPRTLLSIDKEMPGQRSINKHIRTWMSNPKASYNDVAVLIRAYSHSVSIEIGLLEDGIPYKLEGADPLFLAPDIGAVLSGLHLMNGSYDRLDPIEKMAAAMKFVSYPDLGLDKTNLTQLRDRVRQDPDGTPVFLDEAIYDERDQNKKTRLRERSLAWRNMQNTNRSKSPQACIKEIMEILRIQHEIEYTSKNDEEKNAKRERFEAFILYAEHCQMTLAEFVDHIQALSGKSSSKAASDGIEERGRVLITSLHRSKGLEFPLVIIPKLIEGKFPMIKNGFISAEEVEDERRLLYVGITRAQNQCILISPNDDRFERCSKMGDDQPREPIEPGEGAASRFLYELNPFLCQLADQIMRGDAGILQKVKSPEKMISYIKTYAEVNNLIPSKTSNS